MNSIIGPVVKTVFILRFTPYFSKKSSIHILAQATFKPVKFAATVQEIHKFCSMPEKKAFQRLSNDVVPTNYALRLKPNLSAFTFEGFEDISVEVIIPFTYYRSLSCPSFTFWEGGSYLIGSVRLLAVILTRIRMISRSYLYRRQVM